MWNSFAISMIFLSSRVRWRLPSLHSPLCIMCVCHLSRRVVLSCRFTTFHVVLAVNILIRTRSFLLARAVLLRVPFSSIRTLHTIHSRAAWIVLHWTSRDIYVGTWPTADVFGADAFWHYEYADHDFVFQVRLMTHDAEGRVLVPLVVLLLSSGHYKLCLVLAWRYHL